MCKSQSHVFSDGAPYAIFQNVVPIITPQLNTAVPELMRSLRPYLHSPDEFPSHAHTTNPGPQSPDSSGSYFHPRSPRRACGAYPIGNAAAILTVYGDLENRHGLVLILGGRVGPHSYVNKTTRRQLH